MIHHLLATFRVILATKEARINRESFLWNLKLNFLIRVGLYDTRDIESEVEKFEKIFMLIVFGRNFRRAKTVFVHL